MISYRYGGGETYLQAWPIENLTRVESPFVTGDSLSGSPYGSLVENYWLISTGISIKVHDDVPFFMSTVTTLLDFLCPLIKFKFNSIFLYASVIYIYRLERCGYKSSLFCGKIRESLRT